ncbi:MAG: LPS export ABC transporter periplasmic protein LptC [Bdellovibrionaceae bacterium]|nr:LPS export ABC transporter periplasmic protein LptC [Bdellovibrionales bacterium]MCB9086115.1 LPS export ABC transporter periplasmic protein LptC [Pseudobdellovibrionaceae bacterium]
MKIGKFLLGLLFVVLVVEIIVIAPKDVDQPPPEDSEETVAADSDSGVEQLMRGAHLVETREGEKEWELWADTATSYKEKAQWSLQTVKTRFFGKDGVHFTVTGERGTVQVQTKDMTVKGNVRIRSSNGYIFKTEEVMYHSGERRLMAPLPVTMWGIKDEAGHSLHLRGQSLEADLNNALMTVSRDVRGEKPFKNEKRLLIRSQRADFSGKSNLARFSGEVVMDFDSMRITGPEAVFEYGPDANLVRSVHVSGGVRVSDLDKWATSQKVSVNFDKDKYVFRGNPKVVQNNDELQGEEIVFLDGGKRVEVLKARAKVDKSRMEKVN